MIGHREAQALISARLDGPLDAAANRELAAHLSTCDECRAFADQMQMMARGIRDLPLLAPSPTVRRGVYDHIDGRRSGWSWLPSRGRLAPLAIAALLVLVVAGTVLAATLPRFREPEDPVRIGAPVVETGTAVAAMAPTEAETETVTVTAGATATPSLEATATATVLPTATPEPFDVRFATETAPSVPEVTATMSPVATATTAPAIATATTAPPEATATAPPTATATLAPTVPPPTDVPPTTTATPDVIAAGAPSATPIRATATSPPPATSTPRPVTPTPAPPPATFTAVPATPTLTPEPPTATIVPTATLAPTATPTVTVAPATATATATATLEPTATATPVPPTPTLEPTPTATATSVPPTATATATATPEPAATATEAPSATATEAPAAQSVGPPTIAPRDATGDAAPAATAPSRRVRTAGGETATVTPEAVEIDPTATPTPRLVATSGPVVATVTPLAPAETCEPAVDDDGRSGPPTIAPMNADAPAPAEDDPCATAPTAENAETEDVTATAADVPEPTEASQLVVPDAIESLPAETVAAGGTAAVVEVDDEVATAMAAIVEVPADSPSETPVPVVPDTSTGTAREPAEGITLPGETEVADETAGGIAATATSEVMAAGGESTGVDGVAAAEVIVAALPVARAPGGPLPLAPDGNRFVAGANGEQLWIVGFDGATQAIGGPEPFYPTWSPDGGQLLIAYYPDDSEGSSLGVVDAFSGAVTRLTEQDGDAVHRDVPAGWQGQTPVFQRTYLDEPNRGVELWRGGEAAPFWSMEDVEVYTVRPISSDRGFLLATSAGWLSVGAGGDASNLGPSAITGRIDKFAVGPGGVLAYANQGELVIASVDAPGNVRVALAYGGNGFDWSPDGNQLAVANGSSIAFVTRAGETVATAETWSGAAVSGLAWTGQGVLFIDSESGELQRISAPL